MPNRVPVVVIQHTNQAPDAVTFRKGTDNWELHKEIKQRHSDILIGKNLPGSFTGTSLESWLKERDISKVTIAGYMTQMCCDTTARQAFHRGLCGELPVRCNRHLVSYQYRRNYQCY